MIDAEERLIDYEGPRGLQHLVTERRQDGVPMPFRISIRHNSRLALVEWLVTPPTRPLSPSSAGLPGESDAREGDLQSVLTEDPHHTTGAGNDLVRPLTTSRRIRGKSGKSQHFSTNGGSNRMKKSRKGSQDATGYSGVNDEYADDDDGYHEGDYEEEDGEEGGRGREGFDEHVPETYELRPLAWKKKLKVGDRLILRGSVYTVTVPLIAPKSSKRPASGAVADGSSSALNTARDGDQSSASNLDDTSNNMNNTNTNNSETDTSNNVKKKKKQSSSADNSAVDRNQDGDDDEEDDDDEDEDKVVEETELIEKCTENHISLDRPWLLPDAFAIEAYKGVTPVFYLRPYYALKRFLQGTYPAQKFAQIMAIRWHKISLWCDYLATFFDDESSSRAYYQRLSLASLENKYYWLSMSHTVVNMSYDFTLRKNAAKYVYKLGKSIYSLVKLVRSAVKTANAAANETPYEYWQRSLAKVEIRAYLETGPDQEVVLGEFRMDLAAPVEIMREYLYRTFRETLNKTVGESFLFLQIDVENEHEHILPRDDEYKTRSKLFAIKKTDPKTLETFLSVTLVRDKERARVLIPEMNKVDGEEGDGDGGGEDGDDDDGFGQGDEVDRLLRGNT